MSTFVTGTVRCQRDGCGQTHKAEFSHLSKLDTGHRVFAVVCTDGLTDYYTEEVVTPVSVRLFPAYGHSVPVTALVPGGLYAAYYSANGADWQQVGIVSGEQARYSLTHSDSPTSLAFMEL